MQSWNTVEYLANLQPRNVNINAFCIQTSRVSRQAIYIDGRILMQWRNCPISDKIVWPFAGELTSRREYLRRGVAGGVVPAEFINSHVDDYNLECLDFMNSNPNTFNGGKLIIVSSPFGGTLSTMQQTDLTINDVITCDEYYSIDIFAEDPEIAIYGPTNAAWTQSVIKSSGAPVHVLEYNDMMLTQDQVFKKFSISYISRGSLPLGGTSHDTSNHVWVKPPRLTAIYTRRQRPFTYND